MTKGPTIRRIPDERTGVKILRTLAISLGFVLSGAMPAFAQAADESPIAKVEPQKFWFQGNWFLDTVFIATSVLLVVGFCLIYFFKVLRPKFRGRPVT